MMIQRVNADSSLDPFRAGQIALDVRFGILRPAMHAERLNHIHIGGA